MIVRDYHAEFPNNESVYFSNYNTSDGRVNDFTFQKWSKNREPEFFLKSRYVLNEPNSNNWVLHDFYEKRFYQDLISIRHIQKLDTTFDFSISDMAQRENTAETMTYSELKSFISRERLKGSGLVPLYEIELHQRTSYPFAAYILTLIGVSVASQKKKRRGWCKYCDRFSYCFRIYFCDENIDCCCLERWVSSFVVCLDTQLFLCHWGNCLVSLLPKVV